MPPAVDDSITAELCSERECPMTEQELVLRAQGGDVAAFTRLVEIYQRPVYNLCYRMVGEATEAEDAAQETFLRAYSQFGRYDPTRPFKTWLFSIASHYCIDRLRRRRVTWCDIDDESLSVHPALRERTPGPEESALRHEQSRSIQGLLGRLAPKDRAALVMRYWYDLSYEEIAAATGSTVSAEKSRLHRARGTMGGFLKTAEASQGTFYPAGLPVVNRGLAVAL
jgi:RNA polymerase sigma-70 factor (ECF subfamily)